MLQSGIEAFCAVMYWPVQKIIAITPVSQFILSLVNFMGGGGGILSRGSGLRKIYPCIVHVERMSVLMTEERYKHVLDLDFRPVLMVSDQPSSESATSSFWPLFLIIVF